MLVVGLMSGTSADGVDAALVEWPESGDPHPFRLVAYRETPFDAALQGRIHRLAAFEVPGSEALSELAALDVHLGERFAEAALAVVREAGVSPADVAAVASHGQTVGHFPEHRATLQIGDPSLIAERTGIDVVADFRARDMAAGGEGAPLAPFFHLAAFADPAESRAALNLGGIANLTALPAGASEANAGGVIAFDVGPANSLLDGAIQVWTDGEERMDRGGEKARAGSVDAALLRELLADPYLERRPPKSTGRERYGAREARELVERSRGEGRSLPDLLATLAAFTIESVAQACRELLFAEAPGAPPLARLLVGGGGAANPVLMEGLARALPDAEVVPFDDAGVPVHAAEAMAFSLMGRNALLGLPNHLPRCTGAREQRVLGEIVRAAGGS